MPRVMVVEVVAAPSELGRSQHNVDDFPTKIPGNQRLDPPKKGGFRRFDAAFLHVFFFFDLQ